MLTTLITGASKGIGLELAKLFAKEKQNLLLIARNQAELDSAQATLQTIAPTTTIKTLSIDLSQPGSAQTIFEYTQKHHLQIDTLINNAGFGNYGFFHENNLQQELNLLQLNITSLVELTHLFLPAMIEKNHGKILNLASTAAFLPGPLMANYYASKAYVLSFSEALANEVHSLGVQISVVCPGPTATNFAHRANLGNSPLFAKATMSAEQVAKISYNQFKRGRLLIIPGLLNKIIARLPRLIPIDIAAIIARQAQEKSPSKK